MNNNNTENISVDEVKVVLDLFSKLDSSKKEIALAALTGMVLVSESSKEEA